MTPLQSTTYCLRNYAKFNGRGSRSELWWFGLFQGLAVFGVALIGSAFKDRASDNVLHVFSAASIAACVALLIPGVAAQVRRLHDVNRSGWWLLFSIVPIVGSLTLLIWYVRAGSKGDNWFGPAPG